MALASGNTTPSLQYKSFNSIQDALNGTPELNHAIPKIPFHTHPND
jgi:hypothetical protein